MFLILDQENNVVGATQCGRIKHQTTNKVVEVESFPDDAVGNAMLIDGEIIYNDDYENTDETRL